MTPQIQAEISKGVNFIQVLGDPSFCTSALKAAKTLDFTGTIALIAQCIDSSSASGIPGGYKGDVLLTTSTTDPTNPDVKLYKAVMAKVRQGHFAVRQRGDGGRILDRLVLRPCHDGVDRGDDLGRYRDCVRNGRRRNRWSSVKVEHSSAMASRCRSRPPCVRRSCCRQS